MGSRRFVLVAVVAGVVAAASATAASDLRLSLVEGPAQPEARTPVSIVVRATRGGKPVRAKVGLWIAKGRVRRSFAARAEANGRYRARVVFPSAGRWTFGAQAGRLRVTFGSVRARRPAVPLTFSWPTSIDVESSRSLLLVENGAGRVIRVDPVTGKTARVASIDRAYAVAHTAGAIYLSAGKQLLRIDGGVQTVVAGADEDIGPIAVGPNGDVYYATATRVFRVPGGTGAPTAVAVGVSGPHGLAVTADGSLLVCDTGNRLVKRIDLATGLSETWAQLAEPRGIDISADGTVYIVDANVRRVVHLMADGRRLGFAGPRFRDPYDVEAASGGTVYVLDTAAAGRLYRVAPNGKATVVGRR
jgi:sugar lactone lactonase YvrE